MMIKIMPSRGSIERRRIEEEREAEMKKTTPLLPNRRQTTDRLRDDMHMLHRYQFDPATVHITFDDCSQLPEGVQRHPPVVQRSFLRSFNANLLRYGSEGFAFKAATRAMHTAIRQLKHKQRSAEA